MNLCVSAFTVKKFLSDHPLAHFIMLFQQLLKKHPDFLLALRWSKFFEATIDSNFSSAIFLYVFRGCASPRNDTCPLVPRMAGGLADWRRYFNVLAVRENAKGGTLLSH